MARKIIPRTEDGKYAERVDGLDEFAKDVAINLLKKFPDVDVYDLQNLFEPKFGFNLMMAHMKENLERKKEHEN